MNGGTEPLLITPSAYLPKAVCSHADLLCHPLGGNKVIVARGEKNIYFDIQSIGAQAVESTSIPGSGLSQGCPIVRRACGKVPDCKSRHHRPQHSGRRWARRLQLLPVRQGYTRCSVAVADARSIITSDAGIAKAALAAGMDVLQIRPGFIEPPGYDTGFIGGCCGLIAKDRMLFCGAVERHPDYRAIRSFLEKRRIAIVSVPDMTLTDVGGIPAASRIRLNREFSCPDATAIPVVFLFFNYTKYSFCIIIYRIRNTSPETFFVFLCKLFYNKFRRFFRRLFPGFQIRTLHLTNIFVHRS